jgi:hypothetical protein
MVKATIILTRSVTHMKYLIRAVLARPGAWKSKRHIVKDPGLLNGYFNQVVTSPADWVWALSQLSVWEEYPSGRT